jgi:hypothetical protein
MSLEGLRVTIRVFPTPVVILRSPDAIGMNEEPPSLLNRHGDSPTSSYKEEKEFIPP